jgi:hypothetical protein
MYWEEIYPRLGESHLRLGLEREAMYAAEFPFVDYGCDLQIMAELEKGMQMKKVMRTNNTDAKLSEEKTKETNEYLAKMRSRQYDKVPVKFEGKGPRGYICYDIVNHRGASAPAVTREF